MKTILIADDDADFLLQMKLLLTNLGFQVVAVDSQKEAEKSIEHAKPDLAIFDLMMENEDSGFTLCYKLKKKYPEVPIIIATGVSAETGMSFGISSDDERRWIKADLYLEKGIRSDQLHREINRLLKL
jgi:two-component system, OmpR family, response regulator